MGPNGGNNVTIHSTPEGQCYICGLWLELDEKGNIPIHDSGHRVAGVQYTCPGTASIPERARTKQKVEYKESK